ncbi:MAG: hypothetical protein FJ387_19930 [Verrucomicrobia bacterium]|nr:hypothetical protein [Verrucomicrobiota bacterium]
MTLVLQGLPAGTGVARLSGIAIDTQLVSPPTVLTQPVGGTYVVGTALTLAVTTGGSQATYQWFKDSLAVPGATAASLTFASLQTADVGIYHVVASNAAGTVTSDPAALQVVAALPPQLTDYQAAVRREPSLISYYTFEALDANDTKAANHGTLQGQAPFGEGIGGGASKALQLTGAGHVNLGQVEAFDFLGQLGTVEAWVRADWAASPGYNPTIFADRAGGPANWSIHLMAPKGQVAHWNGSAVALVDVPNAGTDWHHFAMTFEFGAWTVYWDGELAGSAVQPFGVAPESPTQLGSASATGQERWVGGLDEVAFYSDTLSPDAIRQHYQAFLAAAPTTILTPPQGGTFLAGIPLTLSVVVKGVNLSYQWYQDNAALPGATGASLALANLQAAHAGSYHVVVSNPNGSATSDAAAIVVATALPERLASYRAAVNKEVSLLAHYGFDDLTANDAQNRAHGALAGTTRFVEGVGAGADKALLLTGEGHVNLGQVNEFDFIDGTGTIQLFVRADWTQSPGYNPVIVADRDREWGLINYSLNLSADKTQLIFFDGVTSQPKTLLVPAGTTLHLLAVVFNGAQSAFYWNGQLVANFDATIFGGSPESPTQLGSAAPIGQLRWVGALDEVAFYSTPLNADTVRRHYEALVGAPPAPPTLAVVRVGNQVTISWPTEVAGLILESADQLPAASWTAVSGVVGNRVTVSSATGTRFYRLRSQ